MIDKDRIKKEYFELKKKGVMGLLPLPRIYKLEQHKEDVKSEYLRFVSNVDESLEVHFSNNISFNDFVAICKEYFGNLNFNDKKNENGKISVNLAFDFCIISINSFDNRVKAKIDTFWDY